MESNAPLKTTEYMEVTTSEEFMEVELTSGTYHFTNH